MEELRPKWFDYINVRERRLLGTKIAPDFIICFGPTNMVKPEATYEKAKRRAEAIREWLWIHMQHEDLRAQCAAKERVIGQLVEALRGIKALFEQDPKMYLMPCEPHYRMTYGDSDRVDEAFNAIEAALAAAQAQDTSATPESETK